MSPAPKAKANIRKPVDSADARRVGKSDADTAQTLRALSEANLRAGFLRKVYGLLSAQLTFTAAMVSLCMLTPVLRDSLLKLAKYQSGWLQLAITIPTIASLFVLNCGMKQKYPANFILLFLFTFGISLQVSYVCTVYHALGYTHLVLQALAATAVIFLGLTTYVLYSGKDFSYIGGFLRTALWGLVVVGIGAWFFPWLVQGLMYGFVGALTFCGYILYDTWRIQKVFGYDDYIAATVEIYLDVVNLFLYILKILMELNKNSKKKK